MAGSSATSTQSVQDAKRKLNRFLRKIQTVPTQILEEEAQILKAEILAEVPFDTGKLERSVRVKVSKDKRRPGLLAKASARDRGYNYAGIQHENMEFDHSKSKKPEAKDHFISDPFDRATERIKERMQEELQVE